jgi:hypothetical protein
MNPSAVEPEAIAVPVILGDDEDKMAAGDMDLGRLPSHCHTPFVISERRIRVLNIHIGSGYGRIHCTLSQYTLDDVPQCVVLSYTWDQGLRRRYIKCNGMNLEIGEDLWHFLCEFRKKQVLQQVSASANAEIHYLWIDAICI